MLRHFPHLQPLLLLQKEAVPQGEAEAEDSHKNCLLQSSLYYLNKEAGRRRQKAGGRRQLAGGTRNEEGSRWQRVVQPLTNSAVQYTPAYNIWHHQIL